MGEEPRIEIPEMHPGKIPSFNPSCRNLNQLRTDRRTVELRCSWEGVLNHTWISSWAQKGILLCEMDPGKRSVT